jgi:hypothetical protein
MSRGSWQAPWAGHGLVNANIPKPGTSVTLPVILVVGDQTFATDKTLLYTATAGKSDAAK